jgi:hypothetical protein
MRLKPKAFRSLTAADKAFVEHARRGFSEETFGWSVRMGCLRIWREGFHSSLRQLCDGRSQIGRLSKILDGSKSHYDPQGLANAALQRQTVLISLALRRRFARNDVTRSEELFLPKLWRVKSEVEASQ